MAEFLLLDSNISINGMGGVAAIGRFLPVATSTYRQFSAGHGYEAC
jgi:hypothetical protein